MKKVKVGLVGVGYISGIYLENLHGMFADLIDVVAYSDLIQERADEAAAKWGGVACKSNEELFAMDEVEIVLNLTTPDAHALINLQALEAGKCAYVEKPHSITREDGVKIVELAKKKGLLVGGAPDTWMGGGIQTCIKMIDDGWIGTPVAATAFMTCHGHESWHPDPAFYYKVGGGPMFDMGPYYLTALISMLGPIASVAGSTRITSPQRTITSQPRYGTKIDVEVPTHVAGLINFQSGAVGSVITSFDVWAAQLPRIEIYGTRGSLSVPDPNTFGGPVRLFRAGSEEWEDVPVPFGYIGNSRGLGLADMAVALRTGRKPRNDGTQTYHVLDAMHAFHDASDTGTVYKLASTCERPAPLPLGLRDGQIEADE